MSESRLEQQILVILQDGEMSGREINSRLNKAGISLLLGLPAPYPELHKLEKKGYVTSRFGNDRPEERNGARRKYYRLTESGKRIPVEAGQVDDSVSSPWQPA